MIQWNEAKKCVIFGYNNNYKLHGKIFAAEKNLKLAHYEIFTMNLF